ncbi:MAG TPA: TolC family protein [Polyangiales bacterium]|nr:TolC family protein [Polyangiales bacterium]
MIARWMLMLALCLPGLARAQEPKGRTVTLKQVIERARTSPPAILAALAALRRTQAQESYARGAYIPRVTIETGTGINYQDQPYLPIETQKERARVEAMFTPEQIQAAIENGTYSNLPDRFSAASQNSYGRLNVDYALFDLQRRYAITTAQLNSKAQSSAYVAAQRTAIQAASELYLRAVAADAFVDDARLTLERRDSQWKAIAGLSKAGLRPSVDATRAEIEAVAAKFALETREIELRSTSAALAVAMGDDPNRPASAEGFDDTSLPPAREPLKASAVAVEQRPEIHRLQLALSSRRNDHRSAIGARLPTAGLIGSGNLSYQNVISGNGYQGRFLNATGSIYVRWSALDPAIWRRANVTSKAIDEAQRQLEQQVLAVRAEVVDAAYQVQRARALVDQATQILAAAEAARTAQNERYRAGVASLLDLLDAEGVEQNARRQRIEAERDHRIARVRLLALCGEIDQLDR